MDEAGDGQNLSQYEKDRLLNMKRNVDFLSSLGILPSIPQSTDRPGGQAQHTDEPYAACALGPGSISARTARTGDCIVKTCRLGDIKAEADAWGAAAAQGVWSEAQDIRRCVRTGRSRTGRGDTNAARSPHKGLCAYAQGEEEEGRRIRSVNGRRTRAMERRRGNIAKACATACAKANTRAYTKAHAKACANACAHKSMHESLSLLCECTHECRGY